jgi:hypothetical protein
MTSFGDRRSLDCNSDESSMLDEILWGYSVDDAIDEVVCGLVSVAEFVTTLVKFCVS